MWLYSGKSGLFGQSACIWEKAVVFGQSGFIWAKVVVFGQMMLYWGKGSCIRAKLLYSGYTITLPEYNHFCPNTTILPK